MTDQPTNDDFAADDPCAANADACREAVEELYGFLDGELTPAKRASISEHLHACSGCFDAYEFHTELKTVISEKCRSSLPDGLRDRVFDALRALDT